MKKVLGVLGLIAVIGVSSAFVYADGPLSPRFEDRHIDNNYEHMDEWHQERMEYEKERLEEEVKKGNISEEEAREWEEHYEYMDKFHDRNGFGGCHYGRGMGRMMRRGHRRGINR